MRKTKIIATIGPACETEECLAELMYAGMDIARFNTKHNVPEWHRERIQRVCRVAQSLGRDIKILLDLQGPEVRIKSPLAPSFSLKKGELAYFTDSVDKTSSQQVILIPEQVVQSLEPGRIVIIEDGLCELQILDKKNGVVTAEAIDNCVIKDSKTMNTPGLVLNMPSLLPKDIDFLESLQNDCVDYVGLSFVRDAKDIQILREELQKRNMKCQITAKIENQKALDNIHELIAEADSIMIARGDLAVEIPYFQVPYWQKYIIKECNHSYKFVITATQMMLTMMNNPLPSRAEISDVANAVYDGTSAVMLSEETAMGKYPIKSVQTMAKIVEYYESIV